MRGWLSECTKSHTRCWIQGQDGHEFRGPLRLLELKEDSIVLRENVEDVEYACLSHCWGKSPADIINKTTEQTLDIFKEGITESNLTANFRDAIDVCRALDIKYLWIDSLCIIQDQKGNRDWNNQAATMADIYENAHVTIAATRAADSSGGCYSRRHPKHLAKSVPGYEGVFASVEPTGLPVDFKLSAIPLNLPLLERGWVYQEMRLSRRVLHFCDEQVVWICQTSRRSESKCNDGVIDHFKTMKDISYEYMTHGIPSRDPKLLWYRCVHEYSRLQLTYPNKDRMAALAGLVKRMQDFHTMGRYLSGMWETSLIFDLGWFTELPLNANSENIAANDLVTAPTYPSWSWPSVKTPVEWVSDAYYLKPLARLKQINCVADGPVHMGSLKPSGSITIQARAIKVSCLSQAPIQNTALIDVRIIKYRPDRKAQEHQAETGGLLLVLTRISVAFEFADAIHVKLRSHGETDERVGETYERVGFAFLHFHGRGEEIEEDESEEDEGYDIEEDGDYDNEEDEEYHSDSHISPWREPWNAFPLMEVTLV